MSKVYLHIRLFPQIIGRAAICLTALFIFNAAASAATFTVDTTADDAALSACTDATPGDCSLRGAINNANSLAGADTINFDAAVFSTAQMITLTTDSIPRQLIINSDLTVNGPGASLLTLKGNAGYAVPIFEINGGIVGISGLKLTGGNGRTINSANGISTAGGAIYISGGTVTVTGSTLSNNYANFGAAVAVLGGSLAVTGSTISNNDIGTSGNGGGIGNSGGVVTITDSTISNNTARIGGGIYNENGVMNITNSTVSGNIAKPEVFVNGNGERDDFYGYGGGIFNTTGATLTVTNSTFSGNSADGYNV